MSVNFELKKRLGAGHFGEVWLAHEDGLDIDIALKMIPPSRIPNQGNFFQEAQTLKMVEHPNIVAVNDTGKMDDGRVYVSMEYLPNGSLEDETSGAYLRLSRSRQVMIDMLRGLEHAHDKGILHRDIKPANILVGSNGRAKLSDFGLALPVGVDPFLIGLKDYLYTIHVAPEVHQGSQHDIGSEIYSCGVTMYRLINGDNYLPALTPDFQTHVVQGRFPVRSHYREFIPRPVKTVINRAMNVDPAKRFSSAAAMRHAVEQLTIEADWLEKGLMNGRRWKCQQDGMVFTLSRTQQPDGRWSIEIKKGSDPAKLRRVSTKCFYDLETTEAVDKSKRLLQDKVLGRW